MSDYQLFHPGPSESGRKKLFLLLRYGICPLSRKVILLPIRNAISGIGTPSGLGRGVSVASSLRHRVPVPKYNYMPSGRAQNPCTAGCAHCSRGREFRRGVPMIGRGVG